MSLCEVPVEEFGQAFMTLSEQQLICLQVIPQAQEVFDWAYEVQRGMLCYGICSQMCKRCETTMIPDIETRSAQGGSERQRPTFTTKVAEFVDFAVSSGQDGEMNADQLLNFQKALQGYRPLVDLSSFTVHHTASLEDLQEALDLLWMNLGEEPSIPEKLVCVMCSAINFHYA